MFLWCVLVLCDFFDLYFPGPMDTEMINAIIVLFFVLYPCAACCCIVMGPRRIINGLMVLNVTWPDDSLLLNMFGWTMSGPLTANIILDTAAGIMSQPVAVVSENSVQDIQIV